MSKKNEKLEKIDFNISLKDMDEARQLMIKNQHKYNRNIEEKNKSILELEEKIQKAEKLVSEQYTQVIKDIFEKPSKKSRNLTILTAVSSICFSVLVTILLNINSNTKLNIVVEKKLKEFNTLIDKNVVV